MRNHAKKVMMMKKLNVSIVPSVSIVLSSSVSSSGSSVGAHCGNFVVRALRLGAGRWPHTLGHICRYNSPLAREGPTGYAPYTSAP